MPVFGDKVLHFAFPLQALKQGYVDASAVGYFAASYLPDCFCGKIQEHGQALAPLIQQLPAVYQNEGADPAFGDQFRCHDRLAKGSWGAKNAIVVTQRLADGVSLFVVQNALKLHVNRLAGTALVPDGYPNSVLFQKTGDIIEAAARQRNMLRKLLGAGNDSRLIPEIGR